tara:strand:+ start:1354 stop:1710 length:357 start_codon:yes stop_codon:yes gene_type:complete
MAGFIQNILWNSVEGFVEAGTRSAGEFAGNALIKAGDMIENGGRGVGTSSSFLIHLQLAKLVLTMLLRHRKESHGVWRLHFRPDLPAIAQSASFHSSQACRQALKLLTCVEQTDDWHS